MGDASDATSRSSGVKALIVDYGGVLTNSLADTMAAWTSSDGIDPMHFQQVMKEWLGEGYGIEAARNPVHALETGDMAIVDFERQLAARLRRPDGREVEAEGLLTRMFSGFQRDPGMLDVLRRARAHGFLTGLLSNSWGLDYPREDWHELFDAVVISGEVGMRKPNADIYLHAAAQLGVSPSECVFVDDLPPNVRGAAAVGMIGVQHSHVTDTIAELEVILGVSLGGRP